MLTLLIVRGDGCAGRVLAGGSRVLARTACLLGLVRACARRNVASARGACASRFLFRRPPTRVNVVGAYRLGSLAQSLGRATACDGPHECASIRARALYPVHVAAWPPEILPLMRGIIYSPLLCFRSPIVLSNINCAGEKKSLMKNSVHRKFFYLL